MKAIILLFLLMPISAKACSPPLVSRDFTCPPFDYDEKPKIRNKPVKEPIYKKTFGWEAQALIKKIKDFELEQNKQLVEKMIDKALLNYKKI